MTAPTASDLGRVVVDQRFRERRISVRKQAGRRRLHRLVLLVVAALLALVGVMVLEGPVFDVDDIAVVGARHTRAETITGTAGIGLGEPILLADLGAAERRIEALPWVAEATVARELPGDLQVTITERTPLATVVAGATAVLVDDAGRVIETGDVASLDQFAPGLSPFVAVIAPDPGGELPAPGRPVDRSLLDAVALAGRLHTNPAGAVRSVRVDGSIVLDLIDGGTVDFGEATEIDAKVEAFRTVFARVDLECLQSIDLRVSTHPVVTRRPGC